MTVTKKDVTATLILAGTVVGSVLIAQMLWERWVKNWKISKPTA